MTHDVYLEYKLVLSRAGHWFSIALDLDLITKPHIKNYHKNINCIKKVPIFKISIVG